jgi:hypothetical protein
MSSLGGVPIPLGIKPVLLYQGAANAVACDVMSMKNVKRAWFVVIHTGANDTDLTLQLQEATDVAAGTNQAIAVPCPIWRDNDAGTTSDGLVLQTADDNIVIDPATQNGVVAVIEWDPAKHDHVDGYDCIYLADSGGHASNDVTILGLCEMKYQGDSTPTVITD